MQSVTAIFDIGKTNKKFVLFDERLNEVYRLSRTFPTVPDDDGHPSDDIRAVINWVMQTLLEVIESGKWQIARLNFSTYGASLVHLDEQLNFVGPFYNYTKAFPVEYRKAFYDAYGPPEALALPTGSPPAGLLNSGVQLYWLKYARPNVYKSTAYSLHLPQYFSACFAEGKPVSDFTSVGCHTMLWDYTKADYHDWVYTEGVDQKLAPLVDGHTTFSGGYAGKTFEVGVGLHDSSAALLPYLAAADDEFILLSTGTWCVTLNPFDHAPLTADDLKRDCLQYMRIDGRPVRATRVFLGREHELLAKQVATHFGVGPTELRRIPFDTGYTDRVLNDTDRYFSFEAIASRFHRPATRSWKEYNDPSLAYHQLIHELVEVQVQSFADAVGSSPIRIVYLDGGFRQNAIYAKMLERALPDYTFKVLDQPTGAAVGAAMAIMQS